jgi:hypothetical protein
MLFLLPRGESLYGIAIRHPREKKKVAEFAPATFFAVLQGCGSMGVSKI